MTPAEFMARLPQARPARFIDEALEASETAAVAKYTWTAEDCDGHFPGNPVVPGVKMLEMAAQTAFAARGMTLAGVDRVLFKMSVRPGETVVCRATLAADGSAADVELKFLGGPKDGEVILSGRITGGRE